MDFYGRIGFLSEKKGITNKSQLAQASGIPYTTIDNLYRNGHENIKLSTLQKLADCLGTSLEYLVNGVDIYDPTRDQIHSTFDWGRPLLAAYIEAPELTQINVCKLLDYPHITPDNIVPFKQPKRTVKMQVYNDPCAAGIPIYAESDFEFIEFEEEDIPAGADFGIRIAGKSMEPTIDDGQIVWIHRQPDIRNGQIGVFMLEGGEAVCKRARCATNGRITALESDNDEYNPIKDHDLSGLRLVGRVLI